MKLLTISTYAFWYLIGSQFSQITQTLPLSNAKLQGNDCYHCISEYRFIDNKNLTDKYAKCNVTIPCNLNSHSCGVQINKNHKFDIMQLSLGCISKQKCFINRILPTDKLNYQENLNAVECCEGKLCNKKANLPKINLLFSKLALAKLNDPCPSFYNDHRNLYMRDESNNVYRLNNGDNLFILYQLINREYISKDAISSTWYAIFPAISPYKEVLLISYKRDDSNNFVVDKINKNLLDKYNIFAASPSSIKVCNFYFKDLCFFINKVKTKKQQRLFGVELTANGENKLKIDKFSEMTNSNPDDVADLDDEEMAYGIEPSYDIATDSKADLGYNAEPNYNMAPYDKTIITLFNGSSPSTTPIDKTDASYYRNISITSTHDVSTMLNSTIMQNL